MIEIHNTIDKRHRVSPMPLLHLVLFYDIRLFVNPSIQAANLSHLFF